jgi:hypothetical protein
MLRTTPSIRFCNGPTLTMPAPASGEPGLPTRLPTPFPQRDRFFKYSVESIDVVQFDTEIKGAPLALKRARRSLDVSGRGGTSFDPVIAFLDEHRGYDGAIIFTDGQAPAPTRTKNRHTRLLWLFNREDVQTPI